MEPLILILVPGVIGSIGVALLVFRLDSARFGSRRPDPPSAGLINMARIGVEGVGGLGLVAMALTVAIFVPAIRLAMVTALISGAALGAVLIAWRRRRGPLTSGIDQPGAHTILIEGAADSRPPAVQAPDKDAHHRRHIRASHA